jgi:hypothetical protein
MKLIKVTVAPEALVAKTNELAILFYRMRGYQVPSEYKMYEAHHPDELGMWKMAVAAMEHVLDVEVEDALSEIE